MNATIKKIPKIFCVWEGCTLTGSYGVFTSEDEFMGDFCRRHSFAEKRRIENVDRVPCSWYKECSLYGLVEVFEVDGSSLGLFCTRHAKAQTARVEKRKIWVRDSFS